MQRKRAVSVVLASLTDWAAQFWLYISTVKHSRRLIWRESSVRLAGSWVMAVNVVVASGKFTHAFHAVFLPIPIMSQSVKAWKKGRAWQRCSPNISEIWWIGMSLYAFSWSESNPELWESLVMANTTTSLSTVLRYAFVWPWSAAWRKWSIRVSASSCRHGDKSDKSVGLLLSTISAFVVNRWYCELTVILCNSGLMNWKGSSWFWLSLRNNYHWAPLGIGILSETRVLRDAVPPHLIRVWDLRLVSIGLYVSQTASTLVVLSIIQLSKYGSKCISVYSPKQAGPLGLDDVDYCSHVENIRTTTEASLASGVCPGPGIPGRQPKISDLVPDRSFPPSDSDGGSS